MVLYVHHDTIKRKHLKGSRNIKYTQNNTSKLRTYLFYKKIFVIFTKTYCETSIQDLTYFVFTKYIRVLWLSYDVVIFF